MSLLLSIIAICAGACAGSLLRWLFNIILNPLVSAIPLGTLAVNWLGALLMGIAVAFFAGHNAPQLKLLLVTGFLGSLTTFSAFAAEMAGTLQQGRPILCAIAISLHVFGSIALVFAGIGLFELLKKL